MDLGERMKSYEKVYDIYMPARLPVIIRLDGKGFSKFTKFIKAKKPFDSSFSGIMALTMKEVAEKIEGCIFGYTQSDEITLVIKNDQSLESTPWFGNRIQKITSVSASIASAEFNGYMYDHWSKKDWVYSAYFDARTFVVPNWQEAINCLVWRQNDAIKNSISAACYYESAKIIGKKTARKRMHGLNQKQQLEMLLGTTGVDWKDYPTKYKKGIGCYKVVKEMAHNKQTFMRNSWFIDMELPTFAKDQLFLKNIFGLKIGDNVE